MEGQAPLGQSWDLGAGEGHWKQMFGGERVGALGLALAPSLHLGLQLPPGRGPQPWVLVRARSGLTETQVCSLTPPPREATFLPVPQYPLSTSQRCAELNKLLQVQLLAQGWRSMSTGSCWVICASVLCTSQFSLWGSP